MGGFHTSGSVGYLVGVLGAGTVLLGETGVHQYQLIMLFCATIYLLINIPAVVAVARTQR